MKNSAFLEIMGQQIEYEWLGPQTESDRNSRPTLVFLHEGLGCLALWRDFPSELAEATGLGAFVYSRFGYGNSDSCSLPRPITYMHEEGLQVLPAILAAAGIRRSILVGHSDGASISLIYAGGTPAIGLCGLILEAPHVFMENCNIASIAKVREAYAKGDLRRRLKKYHGKNVDCAFYGWSEPWLGENFKDWNLENYLPLICASKKVPTLILQGLNDEYGTVAQCEAIQQGIGADAKYTLFDNCGHAPHHEQKQKTLSAMIEHIESII